MSDSGMPQPPPSGFRAGLPLFPPGKEDGQSARIERATGALQILSRPVRVEGEVIGVNRDGTVRIHTEHGDLDVRLRVREGQSLPLAGTRVEIDVAAGRPPRQAVIRPAPPESQGQQAPPPEIAPELPSRPVQIRAPQETQTAQPQSGSETDIPVAETPLPLPSLPPEVPPPPAAAALQKPLNVGDVVRLLPLPPGAGYQAVPPVQDIVMAVVTAVPAAASLPAVRIVEDASDQQVERLIRPQTAPADGVPVPPEYKAAPPVQQQAAAPRKSMTVPEFFIDPLPAQPLETASFSVPAVPQKNIPVQVLVLVEEPPAQVPPVLLLSVKSFFPSKIVQTGVERAAFPLPPLQNAQELPPPVFRLLPPVAGNAVAPPPAALAQTFASLAVAATLPSAPLLHHFPVRWTGVAAENAAPPVKPVLSVPDVPQAALSTKPAALDIAIAGLPPPAVRIVHPPMPGQPAPASEIFTVPAAENPFLTKTVAAAANPAVTEIKEGAIPFLPEAVKVTAVSLLPQPKPEAPAFAEKIIHQQNPAAVTAIVIGKTAQNLPVLSVKMPGFSFPQSFILQLNASNLPAGTTVEFLPQPGMMVTYHAPFPVSAAADGIPMPSAALQLFGGAAWPVMEELQQVLQQQHDGLPAFEALARSAPNPANPARMPAAALFFLAAVRAGDFAGWLGDKTADIVRRSGRADIISRAGRDFAGLQRSTAEPVGQEWRAMALPLVWQNDIHKMMLYYRRGGKDEEGEDSPSSGTRFIFDLDLNRMGAVQLDGLHRQGRKRLDLIVRTQAPVGQNMRQAMKRAWVQTLEKAGMTGEISFQNRPEQFVKIPFSTDGRAGITA